MQRNGLGLTVWALIYGVLTLALYQGPLYSYALGKVDLAGLSGWLNLLALGGLQLALMMVLLGVLSLFGAVVLRAVAAVLLIINAFALYFMVTYGAEIDRTMIGNILNTDAGESSGLMDWRMALWVIPLGVVPALAVLRVRVRLPFWPWRIVFVLGNLLVLVGFVWSVSITWAWFDAHASRLGGRVLPWSYIGNTARYYEKMLRENREIVPLPDAHFTAPLPAGQRQIVVLVIGESARAGNFDWYGYDRPTNADTRAAGFAALPVSDACATYTTAGVACILSYKGREAGEFSSDEPLPTFLNRHGIKTEVRINNSGLPPLTVGRLVKSSELEGQCAGGICADGMGDSRLLAGLEGLFADSATPRLFVLLHVTGSHGPAYSTKYPAGFARFSPECKTVQLRDCSTADLVNSYDNTIAYTDHLLAGLSQMLAGVGDAQSVILYTSDHGESLGEYGVFLHGAPKAVAPAEQFRIPFLVWQSPGFAAARKAGLRQDVAAQDAIFHSVLGAFGMAGGPYDAGRDIFAAKP